MKASELMNGDWVYNKNIEKPMQVYPVMFSQMWKCDLSATTDDYNIFPIRITPEILEKNGFKKKCSEDTWYYAFSDKSSHVIISLDELRKEGEVFVFNKETEKHMKLYFRNRSFSSFCYLHELQHALRLCGLAELVDHFKV